MEKCKVCSSQVTESDARKQLGENTVVAVPRKMGLQVFLRYSLLERQMIALSELKQQIRAEGKRRVFAENIMEFDRGEDICICLSTVMTTSEEYVKSKLHSLLENVFSEEFTLV